MSKKQQLIKKCQELADKGVFNRDFIKECIKDDFYNLISQYDSRMKLYEKLAKKYSYSKQRIIAIISA